MPDDPPPSSSSPDGDDADPEGPALPYAARQALRAMLGKAEETPDGPPEDEPSEEDDAAKEDPDI